MRFDYIVLKYYTEADRKHYKNHIIRKFQESKGYNIEEFIDRCLEVLKNKRSQLIEVAKHFSKEKTEEDLKKENSDIQSIGILSESQISIRYNDLPVMKKEILNAKRALLSFDSDQKKEIKSFTYINFDSNPDAIVNLKDSLELYGFISGETKLTDFKKVFSGKEVKSKIVWTGKESLVYFIRQMKRLKLIKPVKDIWKISVKCFVDVDGNDFDNINLNSQKKPADTSKIDKILQNLKNDSA